MSWANKYFEKVQFRPRGNSMAGTINSGQRVTAVPFSGMDPNIFTWLRPFRAKDRQIGNNQGRINGWTSRQNIFAVGIEISK